MKDKTIMNIKNAIKLLWKLNLYKTIIFNFHYFPKKTAFKFPVYIYKHTSLYRLKGAIIIDAPIKTGMLCVGEHGVGTIDSHYARTIWDIYGVVCIRGKANIGRGSKISVGMNAILTLGNNFIITGNSEIISENAISFGNDCILSWDILIMDTDFHKIHYKNAKEIINKPKPIQIGSHVWIGCRTSILKGVVIADNNIIASNSIITKSILNSYNIIGGNGSEQKQLKTNVVWDY